MRVPLPKAISNAEIKASRWHHKSRSDDEYMCRRIAAGIVRPAVNCARKATPADKFYAIGSCFAREIEACLSERGMTVLSKPDKKTVISYRRGAYMNRYTPMAMLHDVQVAFGIKKQEPGSIIRATAGEDAFLDLHSHPARGLVEEAKTIERRREVEKILFRMREADIIVMTLGLVEAWWDQKEHEYVNMGPVGADMAELYVKRFELRVLTYAECFTALEAIYDILLNNRKQMPHIFITTSPVPLNLTFTGQDVGTANTHSKSLLRTACGEWADAHPEHVTYFPSYEMAMLSDPKQVWQADRAHVQERFVGYITDHFMATCMEGVTVSDSATEEALEKREAMRQQRAKQRAKADETHGAEITVEPPAAQWFDETAAKKARQERRRQREAATATLSGNERAVRIKTG